MSASNPQSEIRTPAAAFWEQRLLQAAERAIPDSTLPWWVAHTRPRTEKALGLDLRTLGIRFYLPLQRSVTRSARSGRTSEALVPVFAGYVFILADQAQRERALRTNRIATTLEVTDQAALVRELRAVQTVLATDTAFEFGRPLQRGDWVEVMAGPLAGVQGRVQSRKGRTRLVLSVEMLSQSVVVEVERNVLQRVDPPA